MVDVKRIYEKLMFRFPMLGLEVAEERGRLYIITKGYITQGQYNKIENFMTKLLRDEDLGTKTFTIQK
jgi:hypothetical protein